MSGSLARPSYIVADMAENGRILTTHVGSLPRPQDVVDVVFAEDKGEEVDPQEYERVIGAAVKDRVQHQVDAGVDIVSDGEMSKIGYATFIRHRLSGFEVGDVPRATPADLDAYPSFRDRLAAAGATAKYLRPICRGPIAYENREPLERDLEHLRNAIEGQPVQGAFMNAPSPGIVALFQPNEYYDSTDAYLDAIAEAMKTEYEGIVEAGFYLQIDAPDLAMGRHIMYRDEPDEVFVERAAVHVDAINQALRDVPGDRVRVHLCWGNYEGPHHLDIELEKIFDDVMRLKASALQFEAANPRHAHEWAVWRANADKIPEDKILIPGVLDTTANYIEHPALVAERLGNFVDIVGVDRVIAGTDCGFGTWAGFGPIDPTICWAKLASMAEGAKLAYERARSSRGVVRRSRASVARGVVARAVRGGPGAVVGRGARRPFTRRVPSLACIWCIGAACFLWRVRSLDGALVGARGERAQRPRCLAAQHCERGRTGASRERARATAPAAPSRAGRPPR